jgi:pyruvate,water dikinase
MAALATGDAALVRQLCEGEAAAASEAARRLPELEHALADYLERFGERCPEELKLESPTLHDDPLPLLRAIGQEARLQAAGKAAGGDGGSCRQDDLRLRALAGHPLRRLVFGWVLRRTRACVQARENLRFERTRVFGRARLVLLELGRRLVAIDRLDDARDVLYLEQDELIGAVEGWATTADLRVLAAARKAEYARYRTLPPPPDRFETSASLPRGPARAVAAGATPPEGDTLRGQGCWPGIVRGTVRVVTDPTGAPLRPGEILVAERTDPGWVLIFPAASGLLVERGSLLSHSAIIARELGLPTIVALPGLTRWLADGDWVEMDGGRGVVTRIAVPAPGGADAPA